MEHANPAVSDEALDEDDVVHLARGLVGSLGNEERRGQPGELGERRGRIDERGLKSAGAATAVAPPATAPSARALPPRIRKDLRVLELVTSAPHPHRARYVPAMAVARVGFFDEPPALQKDDERRRRSLHALLRSTPGFIAGYELRDERSGRLMHISLWESESALEAGEQAVRARPVSDQRGISPSRVEHWVLDRSF